MPNQRERGPWSGAWPWLLALLALCIVGVVIWLVATSDHTSSKGGSASPPVTSVPVVPVVPPSGALRVAGNQVLDSTGRQYIPYGFVVWCLSSPDLSCAQSSSTNPNTDADKIRAAASFWHANTVRIQVAWQRLFVGTTTTVDRSYLAQLDSEVALVRSLHMLSILTLQTERYHGSFMPDSHAVSFWSVMARHYASDPTVAFDLFNEPRLNAMHWPGWTETSMWEIWRNGGSVTLTGDSTPTTFVGMQQLVDTIRTAGAANVVVAEGNQTDHDLSLLPQYTLTGQDIAYGMEPDLGRGVNFPYADDTPRLWATSWGTLSETYPIMMEGFQDYPGASLCNPRSPQLFPQLLAALKADHLGMIFYSLDPGIGVVGNNLQQPTSFDGVTRFDCSADLATNSAGPGADLLGWFRANSSPLGG
jgi:hypothetical protein